MTPPVPSRARHAQYTRLVIGTTCNIWHLYRRVQARYVSVMSGSVNSRTICMPICMRQRGHFHSQGSAGTFTLKAASFTLAAPQPRARPHHSHGHGRTTAMGTAIPRATGHSRTTCAHTEGGTWPCRRRDLVCRMPTEPAVDGAYMKPGDKWSRATKSEGICTACSSRACPVGIVLVSDTCRMIWAPPVSTPCAH